MTPSPDNRCTFTYSDARRCRMLSAASFGAAASTAPRLCAHHMRQEHPEAPLPSEVVRARGNSPRTRRDVRRALKEIFRATEQEDISPRQARLLTHIARLLLIGARRAARAHPGNHLPGCPARRSG